MAIMETSIILIILLPNMKTQNHITSKKISKKYIKGEGGSTFSAVAP